jgi:hypothetical protein
LSFAQLSPQIARLISTRIAGQFNSRQNGKPQADRFKLMKSSKLLSLFIAFGLLCSAALQAQDDQGGRKGRGGQGGRGGMMSPEARVEQLDKAVMLTAEQKTKITEIYKKAGEDVRAAMQEAKGDRDAARTKMMEMMKKTRDDVRAQLTDEQKTKFDAMPQRGGGDQGGRRGKRGGDNNK